LPQVLLDIVSILPQFFASSKWCKSGAKVKCYNPLISGILELLTELRITLMQLKHPTSTQPTLPLIAPIDPTSIIQSTSPTAVILAIAILIFITLGSITGLIQVILATAA
jgi:hypothetical protein